MKQATKDMMVKITDKLYPNVQYDKAMAMLKADAYPNNAFVRMRSGAYVLMDRYYKLID